MGFFAANLAGRIEQQCSALPANQPWQEIGKPRAGMKAQFDKIGGEARLRTEDTEIRDERQSKAPTDSGTVNRTDDGFAAGMEPRHFGVQRIPCLGSPCLLLGLSLQIVKMCTCTEMLPDRGEHKGAAFRIVTERLESGG
jgi:hypothetical protein